MASGISGARPKGGKKNRKHGRGVRKVARSRWKTYANLIAHCEQNKQLRMIRRAIKFARLRQKREARNSNQSSGGAPSASLEDISGGLMDFVKTTPRIINQRQAKEAAAALAKQEADNAKALPAGYRYGTIPGMGPLKKGV